MSHLFSKVVLADATRNITIPDLESKIAILRWWLDMYDAGSLQKKSEKEFEWVYNESLFGTILGYTSIVSGEYTREKEPRNESNEQKPDIGLGFYSPTIATTQAVVELKDAATSLDRPQQRAGNLTPIQQAFKYKPLYNSKWVIVSNFFEIRLYTDTYQDYESFTLRELVNPADDYSIFRQFYTIFHASRLTSKSGESETERLLARVRIEEEKISKEFYKEYKSLRLELMRDIWKNNPESQNADVIEQSQRIIDRIVFICFCEDRGLIPQNELSYRVTQAKTFGFAPWEMLKKFFISIDSGDVSLGIPDGYNGGLFRLDAGIDALSISDGIIEQFVSLGRYDFSEDGGQLSVEILGHIFEQSISDIEEIRSKIETSGKVDEELPTDKKVSKRKKDGIFYTPAYIVNYIVENSLGKYLAEHEEALQEKYALKSDINEKNYRKREIEAYTEYQKILQNVKVLDPACGSGAFLVRVFDWLLAENQRVANILYAEKWDQIRIWDSEDYFREILRNNIYGVDLNEESVEITKLSLWLKSAVRGKKLVTLDNNIKCGNSLIDDPLVAWDKAFDWNTEFADIMGNGGFDVIVGNPPYWAEINISDAESQETYLLFFSLGIKLLNHTWLLSFITPDSWLTNDNASHTRQLFIDNGSIVDIRDVYKVFDDAPDVWCIIATFQKWCFVSKMNITRDFPYNLDIFQFALDTQRIQKYWSWQWFIYINENLDNIFQKMDSFDKIHTYFDTKRWFSPTPNDLNITHIKTKRQIIGGEDFWRFSYKIHDKYLIDTYVKSKHQIDKIQELDFLWIQRIRTNSTDFQSKWLITQYFHKWFVPIDSIGYFLKIWDLDLLYLLSILNSYLMNIYYKLHYTDKNVKPIYLKQLPIPNISLTKQQPFIDRADMMLTLNSELHEKSDAFLKNISAKYKIDKITRKLEKWWELDFAEFMKELKIKIWLEEQEELMTYFDKRATDVWEIVSQIAATDREIDDMVFELYGLNDEEKRVVLNS